jgi:predicted Zn finger-like uncharacterized protein
MSRIIRCPSCERRVRVPDNLLGKSVRCPRCETIFTAEEEEAEPRADHAGEEPAPEEEAPPRRRSASREGITDRPDRSRRQPPPDEEMAEEKADEYEEEEEEDRPRRRRRGRRRRAEAQSAVTFPAIALIIVGGLTIFAGILDFVFRVTGLGLAAANAGRPAGNPPDQAFLAGQTIGNTFGMIFDGVSILIGVLLILGGLRMRNLQSYGLAMTACVLAVVPGHCCCILSLPFGIWGLMVLNRKEVKRAFDSG